jgi:hypothetical protein
VKEFDGMDQQTISINVNDKILVKTYGNLDMRGWDQAELGVKAGRHEVKITRAENQVAVVAMGNCELYVPAGVDVVIEKVDGCASVHDLAGNVQCMRIGGDCTVENAGAVVVEKVGGRVAARKLESISLDKVGGRCVVEDAAGEITVGKVGGDCFVKGAAQAGVGKIGGDVDMQCKTLAGSITAGGDINLSFDTIAEDAAIKAGGDVRLFLPGSAKVNLDIIANSGDIHIKLGEQNLYIEDESYKHTVGEGLPLIRLVAGGDVQVSDEEWTPAGSGESFGCNEIGIDWDFSGIDDMVSKTVAAAVSSSSRFADLGTRIGEQAARKSEAAARKVERKIEHMMRKMNIEERRGVQDEPGAAPPAPPASPAPPEPARSGISEEERIAVLQMLQEKKITLEEAERLLDALESHSE